MKKIIFGFLAVGLILTIGVSIRSGFLGGAEIITQSEQIPKQTEYSLVASESGQTALGLLQTVQTVELKQYDFGAMISAINGLVASESYYWAFYVNDEYAKQAADKTVLNVGDKVEFKYEKIEAFPLE